MRTHKWEKFRYPLIQGGMGIGISLENLAGNVALCGGMGVLSSAYIGIGKPGFSENPRQVSIEAIKERIAKARKISQGNGLIGINIMCALSDYKEQVKEAVEAGVDAIISGAGIPLQLPSLVNTKEVLLAPIVSSGRVTKLICSYWQKKFQRLPDFVVLEGAKAGGHLGFSREDVEENTNAELHMILGEVREVLDEFSEEHIPLFVAGGITSKEEVDFYLQEGADGVQIGTLFAVSKESDADEKYKDVLRQAVKDEICLLNSPVGLPARGLKTPLIDALDIAEQPPKRCFGCLKTCPKKEAKFCVSEALVRAAQGDYDRGLFFCGAEVEKVNHQDSVKTIIKRLFEEDDE